MTTLELRSLFEPPGHMLGGGDEPHGLWRELFRSLLGGPVQTLCLSPAVQGDGRKKGGRQLLGAFIFRSGASLDVVEREEEAVTTV